MGQLYKGEAGANAVKLGVENFVAEFSTEAPLPLRFCAPNWHSIIQNSEFLSFPYVCATTRFCIETAIGFACVRALHENPPPYT